MGRLASLYRESDLFHQHVSADVKAKLTKELARSHKSHVTLNLMQKRNGVVVVVVGTLCVVLSSRRKYLDDDLPSDRRPR